MSYDEAQGAYRAKRSHELLPTGPLLYRNKAAMSWGLQEQPVTASLMARWRALPRHDDIAMRDFATQNGLNTTHWKNHLQRQNSLAPEGVAPVLSEPFMPIELRHLLLWQREPTRFTRNAFAQAHRLDPDLWAPYVKADGSFSISGEVLLRKLQGHVYAPLASNDLWDWQQLYQQASNRTTPQAFAMERNFNPVIWNGHVLVDGRFSQTAENRLKRWLENGSPAHPRAVDLQQWRDLSVPVRKATNIADFAKRRKIDPAALQRYVRNDGSITPLGLSEILDHLPSPPANSSQSGSALAPQTSPSPETQPSNAANGARTPPKRPAASPQAGTSSKHPRTSPPEVMLIKPEPVEIQHSSLRHRIDNSLPILQDPANPHRSLLHEIEGPIDQIAIANWSGLREVLGPLSPAEQKRIKEQIRTQVHQWLQAEGNHAVRFEQTLEVVRLLDEGPERGDSVIAKRDIAQFEVLGPYAGKFHATQESLNAEVRKKGEYLTSTYLFGTRSYQRTVSAHGTGNILSLVNTSRLPGATTSIGHDNVEAIQVGRNLTFYVAREPIPQGIELLMDYGARYDPSNGNLSIKPEPIDNDLPSS